MISSHTHRATPASELAQRGNFTHIGGDVYKFEIPANPSTGLGSITSWWTAEESDREFLQSHVTRMNADGCSQGKYGALFDGADA
ncbi:hypothetical protein ACV344_29845 [Pseudomonas aeruginosa]|uniref:hypothetical protein n=1 Tax=Pseudomonas aeruginosa TaxID=287 RepID=UPI000E67F316|nr:hypothetical protein [Pseudomonas aeruginosa]MBA5106212.1 hypothetical protein [Pseudomonas aeruginosa]MBD1300238.1 hypothetical protein [Pseudomonas aeruginosa]MBD1340779.1 hypothetical protein [Pseudomonas aeruginosa]MBG4604182.1 hypothetical protein [Pseudomonas aeruginosa]MBH3592979.1 hypothetical protein [Pseudomonas aeruginosa]